MADASSPKLPFCLKTRVVKVGNKDANMLLEHLDMVRDRDSLNRYGANVYRSVARLNILDIGRNGAMSHSHSPNCFADELKDRALKAFKDATKDCEDEEMNKQFDKIQDYSSLKKFVFMYFHSMVKLGFFDKAEELLKKVVLPVVAVYTYAIGVGAMACNTDAALKAFQHMCASEVAPNSYTYVVLIKGLAADPNYCGDAKEFLLKMMDKGMRPNAATYTAVIEGFARQGDKEAEEEGKQLVEVMMHKGVVPNAKAMMEVLKGRQTPLIRRVINIALSKLKG